MESVYYFNLDCQFDPGYFGCMFGLVQLYIYILLKCTHQHSKIELMSLGLS